MKSVDRLIFCGFLLILLPGALLKGQNVPGTTTGYLPVSKAEPVDSEIARMAYLQLQFLEGDEFIKRNIKGQKIRIAILDGGFPGTDTHPGLKHLADNKQIIATWDFVREREDVYTGNPHGTAVLSCIAGLWNGKQLGLAPGAEFLLARTEESGEPLREELSWCKAVEWAINNGAQIIQSSLGYTYHRYFQSDMDGRTSPSARTAIEAARRNILIINSNGNEGANKWFYMGTPADTDSILSIGAIDPKTYGLPSSFSSHGPTADKRLKPNVCAPGTVAAFTTKGIRIMNGTSFSAPLVTGFAACIWQMKPYATAQEILETVEKAGHLYPYYDYASGYGIPKASILFSSSVQDTVTELVIEEYGESMQVSFIINSLQKKDKPYNRYLYYHFSRPDGVLYRYGVYRLIDFSPILIRKDDFRPGDVFRINYKGTTMEWREH